MKKVLSISLALLALLSCSRETEEAVTRYDDSAVEGMPVTVEFTLPGFGPQTRALGEGGELNTLHLAVFGGSGYLKEYVEAVPNRRADYTYQMEDKDGNLVARTVPAYSYTVTLTLSESPRTVHFIGNGPTTMPFGYDTAVMPVQLSAAGEMSYWQMLSLPDGIRAKRNENGEFVDGSGRVIPEGSVGFVADEATERKFREIPLIRNWAKMAIHSTQDSFFTPVSFAVVNVPSRGTIAPYGAATGFIEAYQSLTFTDLEDRSYPGNLPSGVAVDSAIPEADAFRAPFGAGVADAVNGSAYLYERPAPSDRIPPSYLIVYGHYANPDDPAHEGDYFYKVDLMETKQETVGGETYWHSRYYPIYRNFKYQVIIRKVLSPGYETPEAAAVSAGSADVSADVTTSHLADISDGIGRLQVTPWLSQTLTEEHGENNPVDILHVYFSQSPDDAPDMDNGSVRVELLPAEDGGDDIIYGLSIGAPSDEADSRGWRPVTFCTVAPGRSVRTQVIRITGTHGYGRIYRDVTITIQPIQPMTVTCDQPRIAAEKGTAESVTVRIPDGLVQSMFPLDFTVEAEAMTLTPDNTVAGNNLPVVYGTSISETEGYAGKQAFQFVRTITWEEYLRLSRYEDEHAQTWRSFTCWFKTNRDESASRVWVYNRFFNKASDQFENYHHKRFQNLAFTIPIPEESDVEIPLHFEMVEDSFGVYPDDYPVITIAPRGLRLVGEGVTPGDEPGTYCYKPTGHDVTLTFISTTSYADEFAVDLTAEEYEPGHVQSCRFPMVQLIDGHPLRNGNNWAANSWSNVAWGHVNSDNGKNVLFGYKDDPARLNTPVTLTVGSGLTPATTRVTPTGPRNVNGDPGYHEIELKTVGGYSDVELTLSSPGYVTRHIRAGRFKGNIRTMRMTGSNVFKSGNTYGFTQANPTFVYAEDNGRIRVTFSGISAAPGGNVVFAAGGTYTMTVESLVDTQTLFYMDLWFKVSGTSVLAPVSFGELSAGEIARYPGSNNQFVWNIPRGHHTATVRFTAPESANVVLETLYVKAFNGSLYENGVVIP